MPIPTVTACLALRGDILVADASPPRCSDTGARRPTCCCSKRKVAVWTPKRSAGQPSELSSSASGTQTGPARIRTPTSNAMKARKGSMIQSPQPVTARPPSEPLRSGLIPHVARNRPSLGCSAGPRNVSMSGMGAIKFATTHSLSQAHGLLSSVLDAVPEAGSGTRIKECLELLVRESARWRKG